MGIKTAFEASVNLDVLKWARSRLTLSEDQVAHKIGRSPRTYLRWESGELKIPFDSLVELARILKVHVADFYRNTPPATEPMPRDCRLLASWEKSFLDYLTLSIIDRARKIIFAVDDYELMDVDFAESEISQIPLDRPRADAARVRQLLGLTEELQQTAEDSRHFLNIVRDRIEIQGILIIQGDISRSHVRGIALHNERTPIVVLSTKDSPEARLFTLFHETYHILKHMSAISGYEYSMNRNLPDDVDRDTVSIERSCDEFAACTLLPEDWLIGSLRESFGNRDSLDKAIEDDSVFSLCKRFKCSKASLLFRMANLRYVSYEDASAKYAELIGRDRLQRGKSGGDYFRNMIAHNGTAFSKSVITALESGRIDARTASSLLEVKVKNLARFEEKLWGGRGE